MERRNNMKRYRTFDLEDKPRGIIEFRLDDEDKKIFKKLRDIGFKINRHTSKLIWWNDDYVEIVNKKNEHTIGYLEMCYN